MKFHLFVICCILRSSISSSSADLTHTNVIEKLTYTSHEDDDTSNYNSSRKVAYGRMAPEGLAPFQCSFQFLKEPYCGCAIINSNFVITASHCVVGKSENQVRIMVGSNELSTGGTYYDVERLIPHEHYNTPRGAYDIALVKVKGPIQFSEKVRPIELEEQEVPVDAVVQLTGWGNIEAGYIPNKLQYVDLKVLEKDECKKARFGDYIQDHHFCTISTRGGACRADSGGPLVYGNKLAGIVNFGLPCGLGNPDVYAKVSFFVDWIKEHSSM